MGVLQVYSQSHDICGHNYYHMTPKSRQKAKFWRYAIVDMFINVMRLRVGVINLEQLRSVFD